MRWPAPVLLIPALVACTSGGNSESSAQTKDVASARLRITADIPPYGTFAGRGVYEFGTHRGRLMMNYAGLGEPARMGLIQIGRSTYLALRVSGRRWVEVRSKSNEGLFSVLAGIDAADRDPAGLLALLKEKRALGQELVRGVQTKHYRGSFTSGQGSVPADLWVDDRGVAHRIRIDLPSRRSHYSLRVDFFDFGIPVRVSAPPRSEVISSVEVQKQWRKNLPSLLKGR